LTQDWANDAARRSQVGVPDTITFQTKPDIALEQIRAMRAAGVPAATVLFDPAYGNDGKFRAGITAEGLPYVAGVFTTLLVWRPGEAPPPQGEGRAWPKPGETRPQPVQVKTLAMELPTDAWQTITWREGSNMLLTSRFTRLRVRPAPQAAGRSELAAEQWLLIEWPPGEAAPDHYWLSTLPADIGFERMVDLAKLRWRIERDYLELKQEVGLGHFEGRRWRGFHHHASLCIAAYGFLVSERETFPPSGSAGAECRRRSGVPVDYRSRGAATADTAPHAELHRNAAPPAGTNFGPRSAPMSLLRPNASEAQGAALMTQ
jgi:SRSO17 transposase